MPLTIVRQDITKMKVDAIVNAANNDLAMGGGVCGAIFEAAGVEAMTAACRAVSPVRTGEAAVTPGFALPCRWVIHAVGPAYTQWSAADSRHLLGSAYTRALLLAAELHCRNVAFPLISGGSYGYPKEEAVMVASSAIGDFLAGYEADQDMDVYLVVFGRAAYSVSRKLLGPVESYIDEHYVRRREPGDRATQRMNSPRALPGRGGFDSRWNAPPPPVCFEPEPTAAAAPGFELDEPFGASLLKLIDAKGRTDVEVYKRANIDRKLFSKIRNGKGYTPGKRTILALAVALELDLRETEALLKRAGYALSHAVMFDVIVEYFIISGKYDIFEINQVLFQYDQALLGG